MKIRPKWETITTAEYQGMKVQDCRRMKVFGGWIFESYSNEWGTMSCCFIQDMNHEWEIE